MTFYTFVTTSLQLQIWNTLYVIHICIVKVLKFTVHALEFCYSFYLHTKATPSLQSNIEEKQLCNQSRTQVLTFPQFSFQWIFFKINTVHVSVRVPAAVYSPDDSLGQTRGPALGLTHFHQQPQSCKYEPGSTAQCHPPHSLQSTRGKAKE